MTKPALTPEEQFNRMTRTPIPRLIFQMGGPATLSMIITSVYSMADTFFVSRLGTSATGAVGIVSSLMIIIQAVGYTLGMGAGASISRNLGRKEPQLAAQVSATSVFTCLFFGFLVMCVGLWQITPLMRLLGSTQTILPYAQDYGRWILIGAPYLGTTFVLNTNLRAEGQAMLAMVGTTVGGLVNIVLDPLFIYGLNMGISGAALATLLSQLLSFFWLLRCYITRRSIVPLHIHNFRFRFSIYREIFKSGLPTLFRQGLTSTASVLTNTTAALFGDAAVAAMSIVHRIFILILSAMTGFGQGFQPVAGYNYGANRFDRVWKAFTFCTAICLFLFIGLGLIGFVFARPLISLFRPDDPLVISYGMSALRYQCATLPVAVILTMSNMLFQALGYTRQAALLASSRQGIFFVPALLVLPSLLGVQGLLLAQPAGDILALALCLPVTIPFIRQLASLNRSTLDSGHSSEEVS